MHRAIKITNLKNIRKHKDFDIKLYHQQMKEQPQYERHIDPSKDHQSTNDRLRKKITWNLDQSRVNKNLHVTRNPINEDAVIINPRTPGQWYITPTVHQELCRVLQLILLLRPFCLRERLAAERWKRQIESHQRVVTSPEMSFDNSIDSKKERVDEQVIKTLSFLIKMKKMHAELQKVKLAIEGRECSLTESKEKNALRVEELTKVNKECAELRKQNAEYKKEIDNLGKSLEKVSEENKEAECMRRMQFETMDRQEDILQDMRRQLGTPAPECCECSSPASYMNIPCRHLVYCDRCRLIVTERDREDMPLYLLEPQDFQVPEQCIEIIGCSFMPRASSICKSGVNYTLKCKF